MFSAIEQLRIYIRRARSLPRLWCLTDARGAIWLALPTGGAKTVAVRALGGERVTVRGRTADVDTFVDVFGSLPHLPPATISPRLVWDLGANIGLTMAHLASTFGEARIIGVELDAENAALARRNLLKFGDRCVVICAAVWPVRQAVGVRRTRGHESGFRVALDGADTQTLPLNDLLAQTGSPGFVKMDIEGAERLVLTEWTDWAVNVPAILVECHGGYTAAHCARDLGLLGFRTRPVSHRHGRPAVYGHR